MPLRPPEPGLVISYGYLWRHKHDRGLKEGRKDRPCVIVLAIEQDNDGTLVMVAPITHRPPAGVTVGLEIPLRVKRNLDLDSERSWIVLSEVNQFTWPGYDIRPIDGDRERFEYGFLPPNLFRCVKAKVLDLISKRRAAVSDRN